MIEFKIEIINVGGFPKAKIFHISSTETKEVKLEKNMKPIQVVLNYIEKYTEENDFELFNISSTVSGPEFYLIKK